MKTFAAVDLGASSGRVMVGSVGPRSLDLTEVHRFANRPVRVGETLHWDILALYKGILDGLRAAGPVDGIGIDSWAVDYGLLDARGALIGNPVHYRDERTARGVAEVLAKVPHEELYSQTGIQFQPFNTVFQLAAERGTPASSMAKQALLIPDLIGYWLTGVAGTELTNASTTGLLDPRASVWSRTLAEAAGVDVNLFPPLRRPGDELGRLLPHVRDEVGFDSTVYNVGSHDTASAVAGVPARADAHAAYVCAGTWSLVGLELEAPIRSEASRKANFTNEVGVDGTIRYLRNVTGLWLLQECQRVWEASTELDTLLREAAEVPARRSVVDANDPRFMPPGDMPARIASACEDAGQPVPRTRAETVRCILDSLAEAHRRAIDDAARLSGRRVDEVHIVGGGANNELLCQLTADACRLPVVAGPVEATALGNILVQARSAGAFEGGLAEMRALLRATQSLRRYAPK
ncbi:rhamnulokinase [Pendulispora brunnea]|uniref:Rhamnulokinase n=1 Tax=Pendulispora brunnea TaxID=2905690 RepID=A0ABZ2KA14_9BACT